MSKRHKELSAAFTALFSGEGRAEDCMAEDVVVHLPDVEVEGLDALKGFIAGYRGAFPDVRSVVEDQIAEGDKVVTRWTSRGTHNGDLNGFAPTGKRMELTGVTIERIVGDRIAEVWVSKDDLGLMRQLGVTS
jgi:predicted ester cyclase